MKNETPLLHANEIANLMFKKFDLEYGPRELLGALNLLSNDSFIESDELFEIEGLLKDVACLLVNPKISGQLEDPFNKENGGRLLLRMMRFFNYLRNSELATKYMLYGNLKEFGDSFTEDQLTWVKVAYLNK